MALTVRFKAAWAFHQLLVGIRRMNAEGQVENRSEAFQSIYRRLKQSGQSLHGPTTGAESPVQQVSLLESELEKLCGDLGDEESRLAPSELRRFFGHVKSFDERMLIEVVRFYLQAQQGREWQEDRLDKVDFLISRLAQKVSGPNLQGNQRRLGRVLAALLSSHEALQVSDEELSNLTGTLQDLQSEVQWVKTLEELNDSRLVEIYRAVKHDMGAKIFHQQLLPLVVEVNAVFRRRVNELRRWEESRLLEEYQQLSRHQQSDSPQAAALSAELHQLEKDIEIFRQQAKANNVRIVELAELGKSLRELAERLEGHQQGPQPARQSHPTAQPGAIASAGRSPLVPDLDVLQPYWSQLLSGLSELGETVTVEQVAEATSLAAFRLEPREVVAYQRTAGSEPADVGLERFVLAAAALRLRIRDEVAKARDQAADAGGSGSAFAGSEARDTMRIADAYLKHFAHLVDQAVFDGDAEEAQQLQILHIRMVKDLAGLMLMMPRPWHQMPTLEPSVSPEQRPAGDTGLKISIYPAGEIEDPG